MMARINQWLPSMKRLYIFIFVLLLMLSSCTTPAEIPPDSSSGAFPSDPRSSTGSTRPSEAPPEIIEIVDDGYDDYFTYPTTEDVFRFAVDKYGVVYTVGTVRDPIHDAIIITAYDMEGNLLTEYNMQCDLISLFCIGDNTLFFKYTNYGNNSYYSGIASYNLITGEIIELTELMSINNGIGYINNFTYNDGVLYLLLEMPEYATDEYNVYNYDMINEPYYTHPFIYKGRVLATYELETGDFEIIYDTLMGLICDFTLTPYGTIIYQAYDPALTDEWVNNRFYFSELYLDTMSVGDRVYREIGQVGRLATDGWGVIFTPSVSPPGMLGWGALYYWPLNRDEGAAVLARCTSDYFISGTVAYVNGFTFYLDNVAGGNRTVLKRVRNAVVIDFAPPIKLISASSIGNVPRSGYNIDFKMMSPDELSLAVLSGGTAYDIAYARSWQDYAYNIREKNAFYPLNDVPGVMAYIDACFPYIKEAATDKNGNIWMIPISNHIEAVMYDEDNCLKAGLDFNGATSVEDIIRNIRQGARYDSSGMNYIYSPAELARAGMSKYLLGNSTLDTSEFRTLAQTLKELAAESGNAIQGTSLPFLNEERDDQNSGFLFDGVSLQTSAHLIGREGLSIVPLTGTDGKSPADIVFLCVNPGSASLDRALEYISFVCETIRTEQKDTGLLAGAWAYTDSIYAQNRRELYAGGEVSFAVSSEVFAEVFDRYINGNISLDEFIKEADRKLSMYRGE